MKKRIVTFLAVCGAVLCTISGALGAEYPSRAITVNTARSGSVVDYVARVFAKAANKHFGVNFIVNNTAGQIEAVRGTMNAAPDGYTLALVNNTVVINDVTGNTDFDAIADNNIVGLVAAKPGSWIAIRKELAEKGNIKTLKDLFDYTNAHPGELMITDQTASNTHIEVLSLQNLGLNVTPAIIGNANARLTSYLGGSCDIFIGAYSVIEQYIKKGDVVCLASMSMKRNKYTPDIPCSNELGYPMDDMIYYYVSAPKDLPEDRLNQLSELCKKVTEDPDYIKGLANNVIDPEYKGPAEAKEFMSRDKQNMISLGMGEGYKK